MKPVGLQNFLFSTLNYLSQIDYFPTCIANCDPHSLYQLGLLISFDPIICSTMAFPLLAILIMFLSHFTLIFLHSQREMLIFVACFWIIPMLIEMDFDHLRVIPWRLSLNLVLLLMLSFIPHCKYQVK